MQTLGTTKSSIVAAARKLVDTNSRIVAALLLVAVGWSSLVYHAVPRVYFLTDDFVNMLLIANRGPGFFLISTISGHMQLTFNAVVLLLYEVWGLHATPWGILTFTTHILNVALLFHVCHKMTESPVLATLGAAMWGASTVHSETLNLYAAYGHVLCATILLVVLSGALRLEEQPQAIRARSAGLWAFLLWAGSASFGVGIALALIFPLALFVLLPGVYRNRAARYAFGLLPVTVIVSYYGLRWLHARYEPLSLAAVVTTNAAFNALREPFYALRAPAAVLLHLVAVGIVGLTQCFWAKVGDYPDTTTVAIVLSFLAIVLTALFVSDARTRRRIIALSGLAIGAYALIAIGRATVAMMFHMSLVGVAQSHHYHYVSSMLFAAVLTIALSRLAVQWPLFRPLPVAALAVYGLLSVYSYSQTKWALDVHAGCRNIVVSKLRELDAQIDAQPPGQDVYIDLPPEPVGADCGLRAYDSFPGTAALFAIAHRNDMVRGRRVRFIEAKEKAGLFADPANRRLSKLLVSPVLEIPQPPPLSKYAQCRELATVYYGMQRKFACRNTDWTLGGAICEFVYESRRNCIPQLEAVARCINAQPDSSWICARDSIHVKEPFCEEYTSALAACGERGNRP